MGGSASVQKGQTAPKTVGGSAAKYEDKNTDSGSKAADDKPVQKSPRGTSPAASHASESKTPSSGSAADDKKSPNNAEEDIVVIDRNSAEEIENQHEENPNGSLERSNDYSASQIALFSVGDCVRIPNADGSTSEGLVLEIVDSQKVVLDICAEGIVKTALAAECELIVKSDEMEIGDQVQVQPVGSAMFFVGRVAQINADGTYDVVMEGDDPDDIETSVPTTNIRKLMSRRAIVVARWKRAAMVVSSIHNFQSFVVDPNMFNASIRATRESERQPVSVPEETAEE